MTAAGLDQWLYPTERGLYCEPAGVYIDPARAVDRAIITHGHSDHARPGHGAVLATPETIEVMKLRLGEDGAGRYESTAGRHALSINGVSVRLVPAGHILGSAQVVLDWNGQRAVVSGDYKRSADPTCDAFEPIACDVFVTEATFALPVFRHELAVREVGRLLASLRRNPERAHLVGAYGLGKCQRVIRLARDAGYDAPIYLHGAHLAMSELYQRLGVDLGDIRPVPDVKPAELAGALVLCPPAAVDDRWSRRFPDPVTAFASGWMRIKGRVRQSGVELPLVISDHADWPELIATVLETGAEDVWVTHGRDDALVYELSRRGLKARALALVGFEDEGE
ncbi:ligase-associated DNA damage response exonuclease [Hyphomicrobium sp.]|uniref:ligase-associated DNA damage response exonuclease n=1 Tax=Hyphomicrobium sp. TaxID=82 RepID=UPI0025C32621|nr:ligase-associated DNA damage response exonuclease [Hyphomicrobium sp.]MCC7251719.1 ligase-associated DNA damage response exonuclease [Hyphomicrobium sp.]